jgi:hypothetical protein
MIHLYGGKLMFWVAVASREHVRRGINGGFCQVCHGKGGPLKQMTADDWIVYYSPTEQFGEKGPCRRFTAIGRVKPREPYQFQMSEDFIPWRRDIDFVAAQEAPIEPLIDSLEFIQNKQRWGFPFRRGCFSVSKRDFLLIAASMGIILQ